ncbi:glutathione S-transferase [Uliginosibacterium aquaticum]|uniref:Glutathione S-transferase n=1 Tax=Uliginosibacterium aquaticum TaxID=2731212 RepID=A0ABX2IJ72_9RHOO|nr:glutathione S-transferase [Uliginosibacterium aquaticum]NSL56884.1 glutathione S-transferase [Uliginosibacterium aquaticum]
MKLIGSLTSPYVRKIRVLLLEKGIPFEFVNDSPWEPGNHVAEFNPLGKVPALVTDTGEIFFDSPILADYLETLGVYPPELPTDALEVLRVKQLEALADGITDAAVVWLLETRRAAEKQDAAVIERQRGKMERGLDAVEARLGSHEFLYGGQFSRADIAMACGLAWIDFRFPAYDWRSSRPALAAHTARVLARPSFEQTIPVA